MNGRFLALVWRLMDYMPAAVSWGVIGSIAAHLTSWKVTTTVGAATAELSGIALIGRWFSRGAPRVHHVTAVDSITVVETAMPIRGSGGEKPTTFEMLTRLHEEKYDRAVAEHEIRTQLRDTSQTLHRLRDEIPALVREASTEPFAGVVLLVTGIALGAVANML